MPKVKQKIPKKRKVKKTKPQASIGIYIFIGIFTLALIYWFSHIPAPEILYPEQISENEAGGKTRIKKKGKQALTKQAEEIPPEPVIAPKNMDSELDPAIMAAIAKLGIPDSAFRRRKKDKQITYIVPIDRNSVDLTFANMIFKGEIEKRLGKLISGSERGGRQYLMFSLPDSDLKYSVELYYDSKAYSAKVQNKVIAIVIDDFGDIGGSLLDGFFELDKNVCFAIFPDAPNSQITMQRAARQGRETIIHVPMEPLNYPAVNPGKNAILVTMSESEIESRMNKFISDMNLCQGANNHMGSLATTDESIMQPVMNVLKKRGLFYLDSRTSNVSVAYNVAQKTHIPTYRNDIFLDSPNLSVSTFDTKLSQVIDMGSKRSHVIAITHCHSAAHLDYLKRFIIQLKAAGFSIVPISKIGQHDIPAIM